MDLAIGLMVLAGLAVIIWRGARRFIQDVDRALGRDEKKTTRFTPLPFSIETSATLRQAGSEADDLWLPRGDFPAPGDLRFEIEYADEDGVITRRTITPLSVGSKGGIGRVYAHCHLRNDQRTFRSDRILWARNLDTNRKIADLAKYLRR